MCTFFRNLHILFVLIKRSLWTSISKCLYLLILIFFFTRMSTMLRASLASQTVTNLCATQETCVQYLAWENPLEKGILTHPSSLAWRIPWTEEPDGLYSSWGSQRVRHNSATNTFTFNHVISHMSTYVDLGVTGKLYPDFRSICPLVLHIVKRRHRLI